MAPTLNNNDAVVKLFEDTFKKVIQHELDYHKTASHEWSQCASAQVEAANNFISPLFDTARTPERKRILLKVLTETIQDTNVEVLSSLVKLHFLFTELEKLKKESLEAVKAHANG